ncbi:syndecan-3-like [Epinephelus lanceolatus]|uniref:syndecan-3-like n=1 Tax=Epinephelus lanceolatus TaxID=310571 RepID=UPI001447A86D|nr:syndecan-3-like [Epinephelus lanceolatus]
MRIPLTASLLLTLGLIHPVHMSLHSPPEDLEGSGYDLEGSGSGSGDWSEQGEAKTIKDQTCSKDVRISAVKAGGGNKNTLRHSSAQNFDNTLRDSGSFIVFENSKSFMDNKEIFAAVIAGGVIGVALAVALAALLIYTWQKKDNGGYVLGKQRASHEDYHRSNREGVVV